jgi:hypothetical protein
MATDAGVLGSIGIPWRGPVWTSLPFWEGLHPTEPEREKPAPPPGDGADGAAAPAVSPRVAIELFVSPDSPTCAAALRNIERALVGVDRRDIQLMIWDVSEHPIRAADAHVCFTPTLVIRSGGQPPVWIFGALTDTEVLNEHLEVAGVQGSVPGD